MTMVDPLDVLRRMPPGSALYSREILSDRWEVAWLIREETKRIKQLGDNPEIEFRAGVIYQNNIALIPVLVRIGPGTHENIYETWINIHQPEDGFRYVRDLSTQDRIVIHLYGDRCKLERSLKVSNQLEIFSQNIAFLHGTAPWSMSAFDTAREKIYEKYPDVVSLWNSLGRQKNT